jgi:hypothetical protein
MLHDKLLVYDDNDNALSIISQGGKGWQRKNIGATILIIDYCFREIER